MCTMKIQLAVILLALHSLPANCDIFSATANLLPLSQNELKVIGEIRDLINELKSMTSKLERYVKS